MGLCTARTGTYECWRQEGHSGKHRSYYRLHNLTGFVAGADPYNAMTYLTTF